MRWLGLLVAIIVWIVLAAEPAHAMCSNDASGVKLSTIAYGEDLIFQTLDLYAPTPRHGEPLIVFVHGGGWMKGDKTQIVDLGPGVCALRGRLRCCELPAGAYSISRRTGS